MASLAELEQRFEDEFSVGHVHREELPKLPMKPFGKVASDGPGRAFLKGGRQHYDPRIVRGEVW